MSVMTMFGSIRWGLDVGVSYVGRQGHATPYFRSVVPGSADATSESGKNVLLVQDLESLRLPMVHLLDFRLSRPVRLAVRVAGSAAWRAALLWRDWLRADEEARSAYRTAVADGRTDEAASAREFTRAEEWAASSGWRPSLEELPGPR